MYKLERKNEGGFTLIEMSIVLVIIGLIVAGVLVGQDLIAAAKNRAVVTQIQGYDATVNTFQLKFNGVPGDLATATSFLGATNNGDGDSKIENATGMAADPATYLYEMANFWNHLGLAKMVSASYTVAGANLAAADTPVTKIGTGWVFPAFSVTRGGHYWYIGGGAGTGVNTDIAGAFGTTGGLTPVEAYAIDSKLDDGNGTAGIVRAHIATAAAITGTDPADGTCVVTAAGGVYQLTDTTRECNMSIKISGI